MSEFKGKVALITGITCSFGLALTDKLSEEGCIVIGCGRRTKADIMSIYPSLLRENIIYYSVNLLNEAEVSAFFNDIFQQFNKLDYACNAAGLTFKSSITEMSLNEFNDVVQANLHTVFIAVKFEILLMRKNTSGSIVNISSVSGSKTNNKGISAYAASKFAVNGFTKAAALEEAKNNIRINAISPGIMASHKYKNMSKEDININYGEIHPIGRIAEASDVVNLVMFLFSSKSSYITGAILSIDGGLSAK